MAENSYLRKFFHTVFLSIPETELTWTHQTTLGNIPDPCKSPICTIKLSDQSLTVLGVNQGHPQKNLDVLPEPAQLKTIPKTCTGPNHHISEGSHSAEKGCSMPAECSTREWYGKHQHRLNLSKDSEVSAEPLSLSRSSIQGNLYLQSQCFQHGWYFF